MLSIFKIKTFNLNMDYYVYTDGACSQNGYKNAKAGYGIYFGENDNRNISKRLTGKQTNNVAELTAVIEAYNIIKEDLSNGKKICIVTDSNYVLKCVGSYGEKCFKNNWESFNKNKKPIPNIELLKLAYLSYKDSGVEFMHIEAHTTKNDIHSIGNREADKLATLSIRDEVIKEKINKITLQRRAKKEEEKKNRIYLNVPYVNKEHAKTLGTRWDPQKKKWYSFKDNKNIEELLKEYS